MQNHVHQGALDSQFNPLKHTHTHTHPNQSFRIQFNYNSYGTEEIRCTIKTQDQERLCSVQFRKTWKRRGLKFFFKKQHCRFMSTQMSEVCLCVCIYTHSLAWSLAAYRTLTTAVSVSVFTVGEYTVSSRKSNTSENFTTLVYSYSLYLMFSIFINHTVRKYGADILNALTKSFVQPSN